MAYKVRTAEIKEQFKRFLRYTVRLAPVVVIVGAVAWFFLLRSPGGQTNTSGSTGTTSETTPKTKVSTITPATDPPAKVEDNSTITKTPAEDSKAKESKLPETGSADTIALFAVTAVAGTLFWEWRSRRISFDFRDHH